MPRRQKSKRSVGGGLLDFFGTSNGTSKKTEQYGAPQSQYGAPQSQYGAPQSQYGAPQSQYGAPQSQYGMNTNSPYGGKKTKRRMRGGFKDNTPTTGLAASAAPFSGPTAEPKTMVGGKTRRRRRHSRKHRHSKSRKY